MISFRAPVVARWLIAMSIGVGGVCLLARVLNQGGDWLSVFAKSLYGVAALIAGILLVSPELVSWVLTPINRMLDVILLPSETEVPPADFRLARYYAQRLRYDEACEEYFKIVTYHPEATHAYLEGIRAATLAGDTATAKRFYRGAQRRLRTRDERRLLKAVYANRGQMAEFGDLERSA